MCGMSTELPVTRRRGRPKGDQRTGTRAKLVEAAIALIRERGYERTTLATVAERAGMTTGAIYGNFKNRTDLLMAVAEVSGAPISPRMWPGMSFREAMRSQAEAVIEAMPQRHAAMVGALGFHIQTLTHEDLRQRVLAQTAESYRWVAAALPKLIPAGQLPMPAHVLAPVVHALIDGLVLRRILTPELVGDEVIYAAFDALAGPADSVPVEAPARTNLDTL
jgi:AcrR family transcriptional regulator